LLALVLATSAAAQVGARPPSIGPGDESPRRSLWQVLTPEQRDQLWRSLSAEQRADVWRGLEPQERREIRERMAPADPIGNGMSWTPRRQFDRGEGPPRGMMMTPEERQQMREQIREAQRLRHERMDAERARPPGPAIGPAPSPPTQ
jgi:Spy/CpxP family protein refolding chaperone